MTDQQRVRRPFDPLIAVSLVVVVGVVLAAFHQPQAGLAVVAGALGAGACLRLVLRPRRAGSLVVRSRRVDVVVLATFAIVIGVLAAVTPFPSGGR